MLVGVPQFAFGSVGLLDIIVRCVYLNFSAAVDVCISVVLVILYFYIIVYERHLVCLFIVVDEYFHNTVEPLGRGLNLAKLVGKHVEQVVCMAWFIVEVCVEGSLEGVFVLEGAGTLELVDFLVGVVDKVYKPVHLLIFDTKFKFEIIAKMKGLEIFETFIECFTVYPLELAELAGQEFEIGISGYFFSCSAEDQLGCELVLGDLVVVKYLPEQVGVTSQLPLTESWYGDAVDGRHGLGAEDPWCTLLKCNRVRVGLAECVDGDTVEAVTNNLIGEVFDVFGDGPVFFGAGGGVV